MARPGNFAATLDQVRAALGEFPAIRYYPGWIPTTFSGLTERAYRFVHVDVDLYQPTRDAVEYFYPRLSAGGIIVSDDYNWPGARRALDDLCARQNLELTVSEFKQAYVQKRGN